MKKLFASLTAAVVLASLSSVAAAQDVRIGVSWDGGNVRASAYYASPRLIEVRRDRDYRDDRRHPRRVGRRHYGHCVAEGPYLYCWDRSRSPHARPVVHVYLIDPGVVRRYHHGKYRHPHVGHHRAVAHRVWRRWADTHRYAYDRDRLVLDVALAF